MKCYPIKCLHSEVSKVFATLKGVDFKNAIDNGFINTIFETDTKGKITETSHIFNNTVHLSMAFCQYLWIFCKIGILFSDNDIVNECINAMQEDERRKFYQELEFGTAGLRGVVGAGSNRMNQYTVGKATHAVSSRTVFITSMSLVSGVIELMAL